MAMRQAPCMGAVQVQVQLAITIPRRAGPGAAGVGVNIVPPDIIH